MKIKCKSICDRAVGTPKHCVLFFSHHSTVSFFLQVHHGIKGMVLDENNNNVPEAVISVSGINHDVTSSRWPLPSGVRRKLPRPLPVQPNQEAKS